MTRTEIRLSGFGGQGIVLAAYILGKAAALYDHKHATMTQNYGPESRGGACSGQVIISDAPVSYPHLTQPNVVVAMSQEAFTKYSGEAADGGLLLIDEDLVQTEPWRIERAAVSHPCDAHRGRDGTQDGREHRDAGLPRGARSKRIAGRAAASRARQRAQRH